MYRQPVKEYPNLQYVTGMQQKPGTFMSDSTYSVEPHYAVKREGGLEKTRIHWHTVAYANTDRADGRVETILPERDVFRKRPKSTGQHQHS